MSVVALIKISLNSGVALTKFSRIQKVAIFGVQSDKKIKDGFGMSKMNRTIKASISMFILIFNHILTTMELRSGN